MFVLIATLLGLSSSLLAPEALRFEDDRKPIVVDVAARPPLPLSAFRSASTILERLASAQKPGFEVVLTRLEAEQHAPREKEPESVSVRIDVELVGADANLARETWKSFEQELRAMKRIKLVEAGQFGNPLVAGRLPVRGLVLSIERSMPDAPEKPADSSQPRPDLESYIRRASCIDRVELPDLKLDPRRQPIAGTPFSEDRYTLRSVDPQRTFPRSNVTNLCTVLERDSPDVVVTRLLLERTAATSNPRDERWSFELEVARSVKP